MEFQPISTLARNLIREGIEQRGVVDGLNTDTRLRAEGISGGLLRREEQSNPPIAQTAGGQTVSNGNDVGRACGDKPGPSGDSLVKPSVSETRMRLVLHTGRDMDRANPMRLPRAARSISLVVDNGRHHDAFRSITL